MSVPASCRIAVLLPCYNEEVAIPTVVRDFRAALPDATVYVFDNNSRDRTVEVAQAAGAVVCRVTLQGKGNVVRRMFADVEADVYVLADGDATYHAPSAPAMIQRLLDGNLDMVVGGRVSDEKEAYRSGHRFGNKLFTGFVAWLFGKGFSDILSGYRVFSRRFVKSFPALAEGFEIETELTVHALELRMPVEEVATPYASRPEGSESKLNTWRDGYRILRMIAKLFRRERPLHFFSIIAVVLATASLVIGEPVVATYLQTGLVPRLPTAVLAAALMVLAALALVCGVILDTVTLGRQEVKRLVYLGIESARPPR